MCCVLDFWLVFTAAIVSAGPVVASLYPSLDEYMGLDLRSDELRQNLSVVPVQQAQAPAVIQPTTSQIPGMYHRNSKRS